MERLEFDDHHKIVEPVPAPASQPRYLPIAETRPQRDGRAKAKELGFQLHRIDPRVSTFMAREEDKVKLVGSKEPAMTTPAQEPSAANDLEQSCDQSHALRAANVA